MYFSVDNSTKLCIFAKETEKKIEELNSLPELEKNLARLGEELKNLFQERDNTDKEFTSYFSGYLDLSNLKVDDNMLFSITEEYPDNY